MKKIAFFLALVMLCVSLAGCSSLIKYAYSKGMFLKSNQQAFEIQTDSMYPTFSAGDIIVCEKVEDPNDLKVGDIITYWTVIDGKRALNTHRIHAIYDMGDGRPLFATKGDNNTSADPLNVQAGSIVGVFCYKVG